MTLRTNLIRAMRKYTVFSTDGMNQLTIASEVEKIMLRQLMPAEICGLRRQDESLWNPRINLRFLKLMNS